MCNTRMKACYIVCKRKKYHNNESTHECTMLNSTHLPMSHQHKFEHKKTTVNENSTTILFTNSLKATTPSTNISLYNSNTTLFTNHWKATKSSTNIMLPTSDISHKIINKHHFIYGIWNVWQNHQQALFHQMLKKYHSVVGVCSVRLCVFSGSVCHWVNDHTDLVH